MKFTASLISYSEYPVSWPSENNFGWENLLYKPEKDF